MTNEEAIKLIEEFMVIDDWSLVYLPDLPDALELAIEALKRRHSEIEYNMKIMELEDAISRCKQAEKEFKSRTCKFRSPTNCDFCAFHSDCDEHLEEGEAE